MTVYENVRDLLKKVPKRYVLILLSTFAFGLVTHIYIYSNALFSGDGIFFFSPSAGGWGMRWFSSVMQSLLDYLQMPWAIGMLELFIYSLVVYLLCELLSLRRTLSIVLCSALVVTFPNVTATHAYLSSATSYAMALLATVFSVYALERWKNKELATLACTAALTLIVMTYQPTLCAAATLMIILLLQKLLVGKENPKALFLKAAWFVGCLAAAVLMFFLFCRLVVDASGGIADFRGVSARGLLARGLKDQLGYYARTTYEVAHYYLLHYKHGGTMFSTAGHWMTVLFGIGFSFALFVQNNIYKRAFSVVFLVLLILALPLAMYTFTFIGLYHHTLMRFSLLIPYIYVLWLAEHCTGMALKVKKLLRPVNVCVGILLASFAFMLYSNWTLANMAYLAMESCNTTSLALTNRVAYEMESTEGYSNELPVVFIGIFGRDNFPEIRQGYLGRLHDVAGSYYYIAYNADWVFPLYMEQYLGVKLVHLPREEERVWQESAHAQEMPVFPEKGYVQIVDGVMLVHLGHPTYIQQFD